MRIENLRSLLLLVFLFVLLPSCREIDDPLSEDARAIYVGQYDVTKTVNCYGVCATCHSVSQETVSVNYGTYDSTLLVLGREVTLDSLGNYYDYHYSLHLSNGELFSYNMSGGLGCGQEIDHVGYKISDTP